MSEPRARCPSAAQEVLSAFKRDFKGLFHTTSAQRHHMTTIQNRPSKVRSIILWIIQMLMAAPLIWAACAKWFTPADKLAAMWPWTSQLSPAQVKLTGVFDFLGGLGLALPALLRIQPRLTPIAAIGLVLLMICATVFHVSRGEASSIGFNIVFALLSAFIAWGRLAKTPIYEKS